MTDRRLVRTVYVDGRRYGPDDMVPPEVAARIRNPSAWTTKPRPGGAASATVKPGVGDGPRLARTVHVDGRTYGPDDHVPAEVAARIRNPTAWAVPPEDTAGRQAGDGDSGGALHPGGLVVATDWEFTPEQVDRMAVEVPASETTAGTEVARMGDPDHAEGSALPQPPPRAGRGSGVEAWERFAAAAGVDHEPGATRDQIIDACVQAGVIPAE